MSFEFETRRAEPFVDGDIKVPHVQVAFSVKGWENSWSEDMSEYMDLSGIAPKEKADVILAAPDLLDALRKLTNEVAGLGMFGPEIKALISNTNWNVLVQRVQEAREAIAKAEGSL